MTATARLPGQAKVVQELARADLAAGHTRLRPADAYTPGRDAFESLVDTDGFKAGRF